MTPRLKELFLKEIQSSLKDQFGFKNLYMGPKIEKIILNMCLGWKRNSGRKGSSKRWNNRRRETQ